MISHCPAKFSGHRYCCNGDIKFLVAGEDDSRCSCFSLPLLFIFKGYGLKVCGIQC